MFWVVSGTAFAALSATYTSATRTILFLEVVSVAQSVEAIDKLFVQIIFLEPIVEY